MMKTDIYKGNVYEIGKPYLFSDGGENWFPSVLNGIDSAKSFPFATPYDTYKHIKQIESVGTITPAPLELIDGQAYQFYLNGAQLGFYRSDRKSFFTMLHGGNKICGNTEVSNIRKLVVAP